MRGSLLAFLMANSLSRAFFSLPRLVESDVRLHQLLGGVEVVRLLLGGELPEPGRPGEVLGVVGDLPGVVRGVDQLGIDLERALEVFERLLGAALAGVHHARVVERGGELLVEREGAVVRGDGLVGLAQPRQDPAAHVVGVGILGVGGDHRIDLDEPRLHRLGISFIGAGALEDRGGGRRRGLVGVRHLAHARRHQRDGEGQPNRQSERQPQRAAERPARLHPAPVPRDRLLPCIHESLQLFVCREHNAAAAA